MKPLYAILLVFGAALAGGLAFHLSQPQPIQIATTTPPSPVTAPRRPAPAAPEVSSRPKPSPMPPTDSYASAPPAVYQEPAPARPQIAPRTQTAPVQTANSKPLQWMPVPYQHPAGSSAVPQNLVAKPAPSETKASEAKAEAKLEPPAPPAPAPVVQAPRPQPRHVTMMTGTTIAIRLSEPLSSERATAGDHFRGALLEPLAVDGLVIAERGARVTGRVVETQKQNLVNRKSLLELELSTVSTSDGQEVGVTTDPWTLMGGDQPASASTGTAIHFRLAGKVIITERQL